MSQREIITWTISNIQSVLAMRRDNTTNLKDWARVAPARLRPTFLKPIQESDWASLASQARTEIAARRSDLDEMATLQQQINQRFEQSREFQVLFGSGSDARQQARKMTELNEEAVKQLNELAENQLASFMAGVMALAVARFNQQNTTSRLSSSIKDVRSSIEKQLQAAKLKVYQALKAGDLLTARVSAGNLAGEASTLLFDKTLPVAASLAVRRQKPKADFTADGRLAMQFGDLIRDLLEAVAIGRYVAWTARWHENAKVVRQLLDAARDLPVPSSYKAPPAASISSLAANPAAKDGQELRIEGVLGEVTIVHLRRKALSSAPVMDARGRSVTVALPYIKLDSSGMVPGSYVQIAGVWQQSSKEANGAPALLIDRLSMEDLGRKSWSDWMRGQLYQIFQAVPHNLAASWSWELGTDGAGNPLRYGVWFESGDTLKRG